MKKIKVAIIGTVGLPAKYGGFETLATHLIDQLSLKYDFTVYCSGKKYAKSERRNTYNGAQLKYIPLQANGVQSIPYDTISIIHAVFNSDVLLILGVAGAWILPFVKYFTNKKIIISIDGIEWKREKWPLLAKLYLWWAESVAVKYSHIDISDNESIQDYTALRYETLSKVIAYGADHTLEVQANEADFIKYPFLREGYAVKVCRIEPENNVHVVLEAFEKQGVKKIVLVGNWQNSEYGKSLKLQYANTPNIIMLDPIYEQREIDLIRSNANLYIHGHSAGGTNPSLVEAMYLGLPVIAFKVSYNITTTENKAVYFRNITQLVTILNTISIVDIQKNRQSMKNIANSRYLWQVIAGQYDMLIKESLIMKRKTSIYAEVDKLDDTFLDDLNLSHLKNNELFHQKR